MENSNLLKDCPVKKKSLALGALLAFLFAWIGLFYASVKSALIMLLVDVGIVILIMMVLIPFGIETILIIAFGYRMACLAVSGIVIETHNALYDECVKHEC